MLNNTEMVNYFVVTKLCVWLSRGEWWNRDVDAVENVMKYGGGPDSSYAYTMNGLPGPLYP